jgi:hypothetical protein
MRRLIFSIVGAVSLLALCYFFTAALSHDFAHEGADTLTAQRFSLTWSWAFPISNALHADGSLHITIALGLPVATYSAFIFAVLASCGIARQPTRHELQSNGNA